MRPIARFCAPADISDHRRTDEKEKALGERATAFLQTGTGLVTAAATLLAAIAEPAAAQSVAVVPGDSSDEQLLSHIPPSLRSACRRSTDAEAGSVSAFNCNHRRIVNLQDNLFPSESELAAGYDEVKRRYGLAADTPGEACRKGRFEGEYVPGGSLLCFVGDDGVAAIVWTDDELDVLTFAWRDDGNLPALYDAWSEGVGPVR